MGRGQMRQSVALVAILSLGATGVVGSLAGSHRLRRAVRRRREIR